ncbi:MAG: DUF1858 domain-containing protein [Marinilabiliaceae bacterium]|jgi:hypothetical protein|nr:DUF1858 domain-containing protein [Marinilabiliaceae bacterium]
MNKIIITPKTKIFDLLEAFPDLEEILIEQSPQFDKLRNPLLRRTIGKVTTLSQAAAVGGLDVVELVNVLRKKAGQSQLSDFDHQDSNYITQKPGWFSQRRVTQTIDVRDILHEGEQPIHEVLSSVKKLKKKEILGIIAPFLPAPLIDKAIGLGYLYWIDKKSEEEIYVYFKK